MFVPVNVFNLPKSTIYLFIYFALAVIIKLYKIMILYIKFIKFNFYKLATEKAKIRSGLSEHFGIIKKDIFSSMVDIMKQISSTGPLGFNLP